MARIALHSDVSFSLVNLVAALILFSVISAAEAAYAHLRRGRWREFLARGVPGSRTVDNLLTSRGLLDDTLSLLRATAVIWVALSFVALASALMVANWGVLALLTLLFLALLAVLRGASKAVADLHPLGTALVSTPLLALLIWIIKPLILLFSWARATLRKRVSQDPAATLPIEEAEVDPIIPEHEETAPLPEHGKRMIRAIFRLEEMTSREIMIPRVDMATVEANTCLAQVADLMIEGGHSRIPVYRDTVDNIIGIVHARDLLKTLKDGGQEVALESLCWPPFFVPESKRLAELLREFQEKRTHVAIVVDEYGGIAGLVTLEDLLEEIVGELEDEFGVGVGEPTLEMVGDNEAVMDAKVSLTQLNESFSLNLPGEGFDTVGGLVYSRLGKIPSPGDEVEAEGVRIRVLSTLGRRIKKVRVLKVPPATPET